MKTSSIQLISDVTAIAGSVSGRMRKRLLRVCLAGLICMGSSAARSDNRVPETGTSAPILVELFTSEGCSTCPPADVMLGKMDTLQPLPGAQLIVLSEHVDYWDHDGWKDPYSSASITSRQNDYVRVLGLKTAYTPQMLVDGTTELQLSDHAQVSQVLQKAVSASKVPIRIATATIEGNKPAMVQGTIEADSSAEQHNADVYVAVALDHVESQVASGENRGRHLVHVAVVLEIAKVGKLKKGENFNKDFHVKLNNLPHTPSSNIRIVAFIQESGPGRVLGASQRKVEINP